MASSISVAPASATDWPFVGRDREIGQLREQLDRSMAGRGSLALLLGEPGIGKTRIAEELGAEATAQGARVIWARSWEGEGTPVYWPWAQVLRSLREDSDPEVNGLFEADAPDLAQILPDLPGSREGGAHPAAADSTESRFRLFAAVARLLTSVARTKPLVVVLDDLHWADQPSLLLLHFVARGLRGAPVLVLGTYRDVEVGQTHPLVEILGKLARESTRIPLTGLSRSAIRQVLAQAGGAEPEPALVAAVHAQTEGNPFFVSEVVRLLQARNMLGAAEGATPWELAVPQGAREMIAGHLGRLSGRCRELLSVASVAGREFDTSLLERLSAIGSDELLDILHEAAQANVVSPTGTGPGRFCFTHELFRETIYGELPAGARAGLHRDVAEALESSGATDRAGHLARLAHHFFQADPGSEKALESTVAAGNFADGCLAYEEAARYYERAIDILDAGGGDQQRKRCELLLALGDARSKAADVSGARSAFKAAADTALRLQDHDLFGRAALGYGGRFPGLVSGVVDRVLVALLEQALALLEEDGETALRASVLARLSRALFYEAPEDRRLALADEALNMARAAADVPAQVAALNSRFWALGGPEQIDERLDTASQMAELAMGIGDVEMALQGHHWRLCVLAESGDMSGVDSEIDEYSRLADQLHQPLYSWFAVQFRVMRALMSGRFAEAERLAHEALAAGERILTSAPVGELFTLQLLQLRSEQGRWEEADQFLRETRSDERLLRSIAALFRCRVGHEGEARAEVATLLQRDLAGAPRDTVWLGTVAVLAEVCASLGEHRAVDQLYPLLVPYAGRNVMVGGALQCKGSASHFLGLLASLAGRAEEAVAHFEKALEMNVRMGARPLVARTQYEYARVLVAQGGSAAIAERLVAEGGETARDLGMKALAEKFTELGDRLSGTAPPLPEQIREIGTHNCFRKVGSFWEVRFDGTEIRAKDTKGMRYLAQLLSRQGSEIHVADLVGAGGIDFGNAGEVIDSQAKAQYQSRIRDLKADLTDAEVCNDVGRMEVLSQELDFITQELASAYGLSRRSRKSADTSERMRKAVTNRIRASVAGLTTHHPRLGQHLSNSIRTGNFCGYFPEEPITWQL